MNPTTNEIANPSNIVFASTTERRRLPANGKSGEHLSKSVRGDHRAKKWERGIVRGAAPGSSRFDTPATCDNVLQEMGGVGFVPIIDVLVSRRRDSRFGLFNRERQ